MTAIDSSYDFNSASTGAFNTQMHSSSDHYFPSEDEMFDKLQLFRGTGGSIVPVFNFSSSGASTKIEEEHSQFLKIVNGICGAFDLTKEELSDICHVKSRKTLYNWIKGDVHPRKKTMRRIFDLIIIADAWRSAGLALDRGLMQKPVIDGKSVFDLLCEEQLDQNKILFAGSRLDIMSSPTKTLSDPFES